MKNFLLCFLSISSLAFVRGEASGEHKDETFSIVIDGVTCTVSVYQPSFPIIIDPMVKKESLPSSNLLRAVMLQKTDITSYLSDVQIAELYQSKLEPAQMAEMRARMKETYAVTGPQAEANPWKGMKYVWDFAYVIHSARGKYLVHQCSPQGGEVGKGALYSIIKDLNGKWVIGSSQEANESDFKLKMMDVVPKEFKERQQAGAIRLFPLEKLL